MVVSFQFWIISLLVVGCLIASIGGIAFKSSGDHSSVGDILFILVLLEVFRLLVIYLEEHRVSVATMVEVGIVSTLRQVILIGPLHINWVLMLVLCAFLVTLGILLRYAGIRLTSHPPAQREERARLWQPECRSTFRES